MRLRFALVLVICSNLIQTLWAEPPVATARLVKLLEDARFQAVTTETLDRSKRNLMVALDSASRNRSLNSEQRAYLKNNVSNFLTQDSEDLQTRLDWIVTVLGKEDIPHHDEELMKLRECAAFHLRIAHNYAIRDELEATFAREKARLLEDLKQYIRSPTAPNFDAVSRGVQWCEKHGLADEYVLAAKQNLAYPNCEIRIPAKALKEITHREFDRTEAVNASSVGFTTRGTCQLHADAFLEPTSHPHGALALQVQSTADMSVMSQRERIRFQSCATARVSGYSLITFDSQGYMSSSEPKVSARSVVQNCPAKVDMRLGKCIVGRIADCVIARMSPEIESSVSKEIAERLRKELKTQLDNTVEQANTYLKTQLWSKSRQLGLAPRAILIQSTPIELRLRAFEDVGSGLAAPRPCPFAVRDLASLALHEGVVTRILNRFYTRQQQAQEGLTSEVMEILVEGLVGNKYLRLNYDRDFKAPLQPKLTELQLDLPNPFRVAFHQNRVVFAIRGKSIRLADGQAFDHYELGVSYKLLLSDDGKQISLALLLNSAGAPDFELMDYKSTGNKLKQLSALHAVLTEEIARAFPNMITINAKEIANSEWGHFGGVAVDEGWIAVYLSPGKSISNSRRINVSIPR